MIDYKEIIDNLTEERVKEILNKLGIPFQDKGSHLVMPTACHNDNLEEASHKLYYYKNSHMFMCYTACEAQSIFRFLKNVYETRGQEYDWYNDIYLLIIGNEIQSEGFVIPKYHSLKETYSNSRKVITLPEYNEGALGVFVKQYPAEWLREGITKQTMDKFQILYSISQNKIIIPHRDADGRLVGIRGRALNEWEIENIGKYMPIRLEQTWFKHPLSMNLYGLYENAETIKKNGICYIFEGEKSIMICDSFQMPNCSVAVCGNQFNKYQLNLLLERCSPKEIVICFDKEKDTTRQNYFDKLWAICKKYNRYANFSFVYDMENLLDLKDSPVDKGEKVFQKLLDKRVYVR